MKKVNASDYDSEDILEFTTIKKYIFVPELSNGLTGEEIVTTLHPSKSQGFSNFIQILIHEVNAIFSTFNFNIFIDYLKLSELFNSFIHVNCLLTEGEKLEQTEL